MPSKDTQRPINFHRFDSSKEEVTSVSGVPHPLLTLQRSIGNQAVQRLLAVTTEGSALHNVLQLGRRKRRRVNDKGDYKQTDEKSSEESSDDYDSDPSYFEKPSKGKKTYRSNRTFYNRKRYSTRKNLVRIQTRNGQLRSGQGGSGRVIKTDKSGKEVRKHKTKGVRKNRQPDIDHLRDFLIDDHAATELEEGQSAPMSPATFNMFEDFLYNDPENLAIKAKSDHTSKSTHRRNNLPRNKVENAKKHLKSKRREFMELREQFDGSMEEKSNKEELLEQIFTLYDDVTDDLFKKYHPPDDDSDSGGGDGITA